MVYLVIALLLALSLLCLRTAKLETRAREIRSRLAQAYSDRELQNKRHAREIEDLNRQLKEERALTNAVIDMGAVDAEMDRLELLDEIDEITDGGVY